MNTSLQRTSGTPNHRSAPLFLFDIAMSYSNALALRALAQLKLADYLVDGPQSIDALAKATQTDPLRLLRITRVAAAQGVFAELEDGRIGQTEASEYLRSDTSDSVRCAMLMLTDKTFVYPMQRLSEIARSKDANPVFTEQFGSANTFEVWANQADVDDFWEGMMAMTRMEIPHVLSAYHFPAQGTVCDVAGGIGIALKRILELNPGLKGILFDQKHVLDRHCLGEIDPTRWKLIEGNYFESVPASEIHILKYILHDNDDAGAVRILKNIRKVKKSGELVLNFDPVVAPDNKPNVSKTMDMLVMSCYQGGRERTEADFRRLFGEAGFELSRIIDTGTYVPIVEGVAR